MRRRHAEIHARMANLAASQYGIVTRDQMNALGYTDRLIEHALEAGRLQAWHPDVFAVGQGGLSPHGLCQAAVMFRGEGALISHQSAAWLWGLEKKLRIPVNVSVPWPEVEEDAIGLHRCPELREEDVTEIERLPVTAVPRTLLDLAAAARQYKLEAAIDCADRLDLLDPVAVDRILEEVDGHPGRETLARAMRIYRQNGLTGSGAERRMLAVLAEAGVRPPAVDQVVAGHELDLYWDEEGFGVELDRHGPRSFEEERRRRNDLAAAGIATIRVSGTRLRHEPREIAGRVADHLRSRGLAEAA
jgi:hypothetical protein